MVTVSETPHSASDRRNDWIVGAGYDLLFFSTVWMLPLLIFASVEIKKSFGAVFFSVWIYHLFIRLPHFAATINVTYRRREQRLYYRKHWIEFYVIPAVILMLYGLLLLEKSPYPTWFRSLLSMTASLWGFQHIAMQNFGILQIYNSRSHSQPDPVTSRLEKAIFYTIFIGIYINGWVADVVRWLGAADIWYSGSTPEMFLNNVLAWLIGIEFFRRWNAGSLVSPATLYLVTSIAAMYRWPFYDHLPGGSWFLVFNGHHCVAYLGLGFLMYWNEKFPDEPLSIVRAVKRYVRFLVPLIVLSATAIFITAFYTKLVVKEYDIDIWALTGVFVVHYYLESRVWRFSQKHNRETTLPLLRKPGQASDL